MIKLFYKISAQNEKIWYNSLKSNWMNLKIYCITSHGNNIYDPQRLGYTKMTNGKIKIDLLKQWQWFTWASQENTANKTYNGMYHRIKNNGAYKHNLLHLELKVAWLAVPTRAMDSLVSLDPIPSPSRRCPSIEIEVSHQFVILGGAFVAFFHVFSCWKWKILGIVSKDLSRLVSSVLSLCHATLLELKSERPNIVQNFNIYQSLNFKASQSKLDSI